MKTYKHLWDQFISMENFELAARRAIKSKRNKKSTQNFLQNKDVLLEKLRQDLIYDRFQTSKYRTFFVYEPKKREIYELPLYPDHIVHHALINVLGPIWQKRFIKDSYACIPGRGVHSAIQKTMLMVKKNKYVLQCDIRKFYPSINHEIMFNIIRRKIADKRLLGVLRNIIWSCGGETNLPIGNLTSQWMGNVYLNELDYFVKQQLHCRDYIRYCDDFCLFSNDKRILAQYQERLSQYVRDVLKLEFSKAVIYPVNRGVTFIGYRHFRKFIMLRKYGAKKLRKRVLNRARYNDTTPLAVGQLASYHGWVKWCASYNYLQDICYRVKHISHNMYDFICTGLMGKKKKKRH